MLTSDRRGTKKEKSCQRLTPEVSTSFYLALDSTSLLAPPNLRYTTLKYYLHNGENLQKQRYLPVAVNLLPICPRRAEGVPPE